MRFEDRIGPDLGVDAPTYPEAGQVPGWYRDAKLGIFVHWGLFSVPAWADLHRDASGRPEVVPEEQSYLRHRYAEWYANTVRIPGSTARTRHERLYGVGTSYEDFADHWRADAFDAQVLVDQLAATGAGYIVPVTKHHDGFCLWRTSTTGFNSVRRGPGRDLIAELHAATRAAGLRFGTYFSGGHDWHVSPYPPITSDVELFTHRRNDAAFAQYCADQLRELVENFAPDVLWNDIEWPDGGKGTEDYGLAALLEEYFRRVSHGVVNDRWGVPYHGYLTREYIAVDGAQPRVWEATRGIGHSFGYNQDEDSSESLSGTEVVRYLVDTVSKNGNLLLNVGPRADGTLPEVQSRVLAELGQWWAVNAAAVEGTRPWIRPHDGSVSYTAGAHGEVYLISRDPASGWMHVPQELQGRRLRVLGGSEVEPDHAGEVEIPRLGPAVAVVAAP